MAKFLLVAEFFRANGIRITGICDNQYITNFEIQQEPDDENLKGYPQSSRMFLSLAQ
jgi:hypothetical protein